MIVIIHVCIKVTNFVVLFLACCNMRNYLCRSTFVANTSMPGKGTHFVFITCRNNCIHYCKKKYIRRSIQYHQNLLRPLNSDVWRLHFKMKDESLKNDDNTFFDIFIFVTYTKNFFRTIIIWFFSKMNQTEIGSCVLFKIL